MDWKQHKALAESSRQVIVIPFLLQALSGIDGPCLDVGCGTADLTVLIANHTKKVTVGIDKTIPEDHSLDPLVHLVTADIAKNGILETGMKFASVYSNCCFCHLEDDELRIVLMDLFNSMPQGGRLVFLVPSKSWAERNYEYIKNTASGITAIPRSGNRQHFRIP